MSWCPGSLLTRYHIIILPSPGSSNKRNIRYYISVYFLESYTRYCITFSGCKAAAMNE